MLNYSFNIFTNAGCSFFPCRIITDLLLETMRAQLEMLCLEIITLVCQSGPVTMG